MKKEDVCVWLNNVVLVTDELQGLVKIPYILTGLMVRKNKAGVLQYYAEVHDMRANSVSYVRLEDVEKYEAQA